MVGPFDPYLFLCVSGQRTGSRSCSIDADLSSYVVPTVKAEDRRQKIEKVTKVLERSVSCHKAVQVLMAVAVRRLEPSATSKLMHLEGRGGGQMRF